MAITTYATLLTALDNWSDRTHTAARAAEWVSLFEAYFRRNGARVRRGMQRDTNATISTEYEPLPDDFLSVVSFKINSSPVRSLKPVSMEWIDENYVDAQTGVPLFYAVTGTEVRFAPPPDATYTAEMVYHTFDALSDSNTSNWLLASHPDIYLFGSLCESEMFYMNDPRAAIWKARRDEGIAELVRSEKRAQWGVGMRIRPDVGAGA